MKEIGYLIGLTCRYLLILVFAASLSACQEQHSEAPTGKGKAAATQLIRVGERSLSFEQFRREFEMNYPDIDQLSQQERFLLQRQLVMQLIDRELILAEATRLNISVSPDEFDQALAVIRGNQSHAAFEEHLREIGKSLDIWRNILTFQLLTAKVTEAVIAPRIEISEAELAAYYHEHKQDFQRPAEVRAYQMLFENLDDALAVRKQLQDGADFAALALQHSISPDREDGGLLGYFAEGFLPAEFDSVIFTLPLRQVSEPVESPYGFHLFMVDRRRNAGLRPFAVVRDEISERLYRNKEEQMFQQWIRELRNQTGVDVDWEQLRPK